VLSRLAQGVGMQMSQSIVGPLVMWRFDPLAA
jgi:hypothetical protein